MDATLGTKNTGIVIFKEDETTGAGSLLVTGNDTGHPELPHTANQKYASFETSASDVVVGSEVEFKWKGNPQTFYGAELLKLYKEE